LSFQILAHHTEISLQACRLTSLSHPTGAKTMNQNINKTGIPARASLAPRGGGRGLINLRPAFSHASLASPCVPLAGVADSGDPRRPVVATWAARNPYAPVFWPLSSADEGKPQNMVGKQQQLHHCRERQTINCRVGDGGLWMATRKTGRADGETLLPRLSRWSNGGNLSRPRPRVICSGGHAAFWPRTTPLQLTWKLQLCYWADGGSKLLHGRCVRGEECGTSRRGRERKADEWEKG